MRAPLSAQVLVDQPGADGVAGQAGHITDALLPIIGEGSWDRLDDADRQILVEVLQEAAQGATADIRQAEGELVQWFRDQGNTVIEVDRSLFRDAVVPLHNGDMATWPQDIYDRLQAL